MILVQDGFAAAVLGELVAMLDQQPVVAPGFELIVLHPHQHPAAMQFLAVQAEFEIALGQHLVGVAFRRPGAAVPQHHRAAAILALGNGALEVAVIEGMVFHFHRQPLFGRVQRRPARHRPGTKGTVQLQPEVVMQPGRGMLLDDKAQPGRGLDGLLAAGFGGHRKVPHGLVFLQRLFRSGGGGLLPDGHDGSLAVET